MPMPEAIIAVAIAALVLAVILGGLSDPRVRRFTDRDKDGAPDDPK